MKKNLLFKMLAVLIVLITSVSQIWADVTSHTVYCAISDADKGEYTLKACANIGDNDTWWMYEMARVENATYKGIPIYTATINVKYGGVDELVFRVYDDLGEENKYSIAYGKSDPFAYTSEFEGKIFHFAVSDIGTWTPYCVDATLYWANTKDAAGDVKAYAFGNGTNGTYPGAFMTNTGKEYDGHKIYKITFNNPPYPTVIFSANGDSHKTGDLSIGTSQIGKMYLGKNGGWVDYTYDQTITVSSDDNGSVNQEGTVTLNATGTSLTATPTNSATHAFVSWTISGGGITPSESTTNPQTFTASEDGGTIRANFAPLWAIMGGDTDSKDATADAMGNWDTYNEFSNIGTNAFVQTITLAASQEYKFKVVKRGSTDTWYGRNDTGINNTTATDMQFSTSGSNVSFTTGVAGEYTFAWNAADEKLSIYIPADAAKARLTKQKYIYLDARESTNWKDAFFTARFYFKYFGSDLDQSDTKVLPASALDGYVYPILVPNDDNIGRVQVNRYSTDGTDAWGGHHTSVIHAYGRSSGNENSILIPKSEASATDPSVEWDTYCPPMSSATLAHDGTKTKTYGGNGGSSTPYLVATSSSIYVSATSESALDDDNMTPYYQFMKGSSNDGSNTSTATHTYTASSSNETKEEMKVVAQNYYNSTYGTASDASNIIYYEARTPYSVTHTLDGVTTKSGEVGSGATVYGAVYNATFEASAGYALPPTITVTSGSALTVTTDYTWNQSTGALQILADKITGNVVITINGDPQDLTFNATEDSNWNNENNWSPKCVPTIGHDVVIEKPVTVNIDNARAKSVVIYNNGSDKTGQLNIGAAKELVIATTLKKTANGSTYGPTGVNDLIIGSSDDGNGALVIGEYSEANQATVAFYSISGGAADDDTSVNQYVGIPFNSGTVLGCFYDSWVYEIDYSANPIAWKRTEGSLNPFTGYSIIYNGSAGHTYWMDGTLVSTEDKTCSSLHNSSASGASDWNNENLLANSWTAPIKIKALAGAFTNAEATIYIFNSGSPSDYNDASKTGSGAAQYSTYTVGSAGVADAIPSMQSFSVFTTASGGSLKLDYSEVVYAPAIAGIVPSANKAPKRTAEEMDKVRIYVEGESGYRDMIYMLEDETQFTEGFDNGWDGHKLFGLDVAPQFYALSTDGNMAVAAVPDMDGTVLGFKAGNQDSQYTISFDYAGTSDLYLYDIDAKKETLVDNENTYVFTTSDEVAHNRFVLSKVSKMPTGVENTSSELKAVKFIENGELFILRDGKLYNVMGTAVK